MKGGQRVSYGLWVEQQGRRQVQAEAGPEGRQAVSRRQHARRGALSAAAAGVALAAAAGVTITAYGPVGIAVWLVILGALGYGLGLWDAYANQRVVRALRSLHGLRERITRTRHDARGEH